MSVEEIPYFEDEDSQLRPNLPVIERSTINAILWNPLTDGVLCLDWGKFGWKTFVIGGVEKEEGPVEAAFREIGEETGYANIEFVADLGKLRSGYFAAHKGENRIAHTTGLLFKLMDERRSIIADTAPLPHVFKWVPSGGVESYLTLSSQKYLWNRARPLLS